MLYRQKIQTVLSVVSSFALTTDGTILKFTASFDIIISIPPPCERINSNENLLSAGQGMIRDYYAHVRFPSKARKFSHGHLILPEANVKETFTLISLIIRIFCCPNSRRHNLMRLFFRETKATQKLRNFCMYRSKRRDRFRDKL